MVWSVDRGGASVLSRDTFSLGPRAPKIKDETKEDGPKSEASPSPSPQETTVVIGSVF